MNISKTFCRVLDLIHGGEGVIPDENIKTFVSLNSVPENRYFFLRVNFMVNENRILFQMKNMKNLNKFLYLTLKMHNLSAVNDLYSFQDTCLPFRELV